MARIYEAKGRPAFNPLIVHLADAEAAARIGVFDEDEKRMLGCITAKSMLAKMAQEARHV